MNTIIGEISEFGDVSFVVVLRDLPRQSQSDTIDEEVRKADQSINRGKK